jgi:hypothetical protein
LIAADWKLNVAMTDCQSNAAASRALPDVSALSSMSPVGHANFGLLSALAFGCFLGGR